MFLFFFKKLTEKKIGTVPACVRAKFRFLKMNNLVLEPQSRLKRLARTKVIKHFLFLIVRQNAGSINMSLTYQRGYKLYFKNKVLLLFLVVF